jgi:murein tripeptide amidase MpaA
VVPKPAAQQKIRGNDAVPRVDFSRFPRHAELVAHLHAFAADYAHLIELSVIGHSYEKRDIYLVAITNRGTGPAQDKPAYWVDGNIHATELLGSTACLYLLQTLLTGYGTDADITRCLDTRAFYICPRVNPDGAEWALAERPIMVRSGTRRYPYDEEPAEGLTTQDIDGDGRILQMRIADGNGPWKRHPLEPQLLVRRDPNDPPAGEYFRVLPEGLFKNYDGVHLPVPGYSGDAQGLDLNRNFPALWRQEFEQAGAGPYPASEPEVRAVVDFFVAHPNICGGTSLHTFSGVLLRPLGSQNDDGMIPEDLWVYRTQGQKGEELTGYPAISIWHEFRYHPNEYVSGSFDWIYEHLGRFTWTVELWNPRQAAGIESREWIHWFRDHPICDDLKVFRWAQQVAPGEGHVDWRPFAHPQLGAVEIGGWQRMVLFTNPPPQLREREIARLPKWLLWLNLIGPRLEVRETQVIALGEDSWRVRLIVQNSGWLPSYVSKMALRRKQTRGVLAEISIPSGVQLLVGKPREELGELEGWADLHTGISFWPNTRPTADRAYVDWVIKASAGTQIDLRAWHERAGHIATQVVLKDSL